MSSQDDPKVKPRFENFGRKLDAEFGEQLSKLAEYMDKNRSSS